MASPAVTIRHERSSQLTSRRSGFSSPAMLDFWWLGIPAKLRPYSRTLWASWSDGIYLTAWPHAALVLPGALLLFGFLQGATHWSLLTIGDNQLSGSVLPVALPQILPLLFISVVAGSFSAQLSLMLLAGLVAGDYLVAGPFLSISNWNPIAGFFCLRLPQFLCYGLLCGLAVTPMMAARGLLDPLTRKLSRTDVSSAVVRTAALTLFVMAFVYGWTLMAPLSFRIVWFWAGISPPVTVKYFRDVLDPWLPIAAGLATILRGFLVWRTRHDGQLKQRVRRFREDAALADSATAWPRQLPVWLRSVFTGIASAFLLAGIITSWPRVALICPALVGIFLLRNCFLPKLRPWATWTQKTRRIPLIIRLALVIAATYFATLGLLQLPGWATPLNSRPGQFETLLACLGVSLLVNLALIPFGSETSPVTTELTRLRIAPALRVAVQLIAILLLFAPVHAFATCLDPSCCLGDNGFAAEALGALGGALGLGAAGAFGGAGGLGAAGEEGGSDDAPEEPSPGDGPPSGDGDGSDSGSSGNGSSQSASQQAAQDRQIANDMREFADQDLQDANKLAQQAAADQQLANEYAQQAAAEQQAASALAQQAAEEEQQAQQLRSEAASDQDPETAAALEQEANEKAADAAAAQNAANQLAADANESQQKAGEFADDAFADQNEANQMASNADHAQQTADQLDAQASALDPQAQDSSSQSGQTQPVPINKPDPVPSVIPPQPIWSLIPPDPVPSLIPPDPVRGLEPALGGNTGTGAGLPNSPNPAQSSSETELQPKTQGSSGTPDSTQAQSETEAPPKFPR